MSQYYFFAFIVFILVLFFALFRQKKSFNTAPKKIWSYWDDPAKIPKTVQMCIKSWAKHNPEYEIVLLTKKTWKGYVNIPTDIAEHPNFNDSPARFSDLLRLYALAEHGGVWIDSSILVKAPLEDWLFSKPAEFSGFYLESFTKSVLPSSNNNVGFLPSSNNNVGFLPSSNNNVGFSPVIESWFFACNKGSPFVKQWRDEFSQIAQFPNVEKYVESRKAMGVDFEKITNPIYLAIHIAAQKVLQFDKYPLDTLLLKKAEDGPFKYLVDAKWDSEKALRLACQNKKYQSPIMKMRVLERNVLEKEIDYELSPDICGWLD